MEMVEKLLHKEAATTPSVKAKELLDIAKTIEARRLTEHYGVLP